MEFTKAKTVVVAVGAFVETLKIILLDNVIDVNEWASVISSVVILAITIWGVFQIQNKIIPPDSEVNPVEKAPPGLREGF